jgi:hypothetical protein
MMGPNDLKLKFTTTHKTLYMYCMSYIIRYYICHIFQCIKYTICITVYCVYIYIHVHLYIVQYCSLYRPFSRPFSNAFPVRVHMTRVHTSRGAAGGAPVGGGDARTACPGSPTGVDRRVCPPRRCSPFSITT